MLKINSLYKSYGEKVVYDNFNLEVEENKNFDQTVYFFDCVRTLKTDKINREIDRLTALFKSETDNEKRKVYTLEMAKLIASKNKLN